MSAFPPPFTSALAHHAADPFRLLVESVVDYAIYMVDPAALIASWNPGAERIYGYRADEIIGQPFSTLFGVADLADGRPNARWQSALATGHYESECTRARKDGSEFPALVTVSFLPDHLGNHAGFSVVTRDLSEREQARTELDRTASLLRAVIDEIPDALFVKDPDGKYLLINSAAARLAGRAVSEVVGRDDAAIFDPESARIVVEHDQRVMASGHAESEEAELTVGGVTRNFLATKAPLRDAGGQVIGVIGRSEDITDRRQTERDRLQLAERLATTLESMNDGFFTLDHEWRFSYVNAEAKRMIAPGREELLGKTLWEAFPEASGLAFEEEYRPARRDQVAVEFVEYFAPLHKYFGVRAHPSPDGLAVYFRDVTAARTAEEALRTSEQQQRALSEALLTERTRLVAAQAVAKVGSWETDLATQRVDWSAESYRIFEQDPATFQPTHPRFVELVHPDDRDAVARAFEASIAAGTPGLLEHRIVTTDSGIKFVEERWQVVTDDNGRAIGVIGTCQDTTERKQAEEELRLRDRAIQAVAQGIVVTDPNQRDNPIVFASGGFERMTGYTADAVLGKNCRFLQGRDTSQEAVGEMRAAVDASRSCTVEAVNYRKDGTPFWNQVTITPVLGPAGQLTHFVGVQIDVTARRRLEEQYRQSQKMEAVGRLAGGVAHDFNNLLTIISGYSELLQTIPNLDAGAREAVSAIRVASERAAALTRQLLGFSRQTLLQPKVLDLNEVVTETATMLRRLIGEDILLATVLDPAIGLVKVDPGQLNQLLMNLCVNARDAMPGGGKLTIETRPVVLGEDYADPHLGCSQGPHIMLAISDTGTGMPPDVMGRVFEPFFTTKEVGEGTGLGLAVVFGIVQQSGGCIHVYSEPGSGSSFKVYLPAVSEPLSVSLPEEQPSALHGTETILLVEDEDAVRRLALRSLTMYGYQVLSATDGQDALRIVASHVGSLDMILTDVVMPHLGGPNLVRALAKDFPGVKVVYMSGYTDDAVVRHGLIEADMAFIQKPYTPIGLVRKVRSVLDGR